MNSRYRLDRLNKHTLNKKEELSYLYFCFLLFLFLLCGHVANLQQPPAQCPTSSGVASLDRQDILTFCSLISVALWVMVELRNQCWNPRRWRLTIYRPNTPLTHASLRLGEVPAGRAAKEKSRNNNHQTMIPSKINQLTVEDFQKSRELNDEKRQRKKGQNYYSFQCKRQYRHFLWVRSRCSHKRGAWCQSSLMYCSWLCSFIQASMQTLK